MKIELDDKRLSYCGRIDRRDPGKPEFIFPASSLSFRFYGKKAGILLENKQAYWDNYLGGVIDGIQVKWKLNAGGTTKVSILDEEEEKEHRVTVFKRQDGCHEFILHELDLEGSLLEPDEPPYRRMEVYGDSISAGEVSEAVEYTGMPDPPHKGEYSNSWYSYPWIAARKLNAQLSDIAQGGIALQDQTGWFLPPDYPGMESVWDKLHYHPELGPEAEWDFSLYTPQVVVLALGQNDSHPRDIMADDPQGREADRWKRNYMKLAGKIREKYPDAEMILATTIMIHHGNWDLAVEDVCRKLRRARDGRVHYFRYQRNGSATPGHLRIPEAEEMAGELASYIRSLKIPGWEDGNE